MAFDVVNLRECTILVLKFIDLLEFRCAKISLSSTYRMNEWVDSGLYNCWLRRQQLTIYSTNWLNVHYRHGTFARRWWRSSIYGHNYFMAHKNRLKKRPCTILTLNEGIYNSFQPIRKVPRMQWNTLDYDSNRHSSFLDRFCKTEFPFVTLDCVIGFWKVDLDIAMRDPSYK